MYRDWGLKSTSNINYQRLWRVPSRLPIDSGGMENDSRCLGMRSSTPCATRTLCSVADEHDNLLASAVISSDIKVDDIRSSIEEFVQCRTLHSKL